MKRIFAIGMVLLLGACNDSNDGEFNSTDIVQGSGFDDSNNGGIGLKVTCEVESDRSKVSVDAENLASGTYTASVESGGVEIESEDAQETEGDEVEFDFDSDSGDIAEGATAIDEDFIVDETVIGSIFNEDGELVASLEAQCDTN